MRWRRRWQNCAMCSCWMPLPPPIAPRRSTEGAIRHAEGAVAGPLLAAEVRAGQRLWPTRSARWSRLLVAPRFLGKLKVLEALIDKVDQLIVGGGIANTFLAAAGHRIGNSLHEPDLVDTAKALMKQAEEKGAAIPLPTDVLTAERFHQEAHASLRDVSRIHADEMILDIGPETAGRLATIIRDAGTVIWNGPLGVFEFEAFHSGTQAVAHAVAACEGFTLAGGGDTIAAIEKFHVADRIDYISTAGGAFLEYVEGKELPALAALRS